MANSHVPYLQTLARDEAIAFVASLQKVKEHLSDELQWMNEQVQQKIVQLQGIDTLLTEAVSIGLVTLHDASTQALPSAEAAANSSSAAATILSSISQSTPSAAANGNSLVAKTTDLKDSAVVSPSNTVPATSKAPPQRGKQRQQGKSSQPKRDVKSSAASKANNAKAKSPRSVAGVGEASETTPAGFQQFLQANFQDQSMTDAVGKILEAAKEPMNTDAIMAKLYKGLAGNEYQRAKSSLSNILSVGKSKGKWKSTGRGLYIGS